MKKRGFREEQIATVLRQVDTGAPIPEATSYVWCKQYGHIAIAGIRRCDRWRKRTVSSSSWGVKLDFTTLGEPFENGVIGSFNGRFRGEYLIIQVVVSLHDARQKIETWLNDDHEHRLYGSLGDLLC